MQQEACHCPQRKKINLRRVLRPVAGFNVRLQRSQRRVSRLGWQPSSSPVAVCTHLLIRSRQPPCRNVWSKQEKVSFSAIGESSFDRRSLLQFRFKEKQRSPVRGTGKGVCSLPEWRNKAGFDAADTSKAPDESISMLPSERLLRCCCLYDLAGSGHPFAGRVPTSSTRE